MHSFLIDHTLCFKFIYYFVILIPQTSIQFSGYDEPDIMFHLGTRTPYRFVANLNDSYIDYANCNPVKIFGIIRHGTRSPGSKVVNKVKQLISSLRPITGFQDPTTVFGSSWEIETFKKWSKRWIDDPDKVLTPEGANEMFLLGKRLRNRFPSILPKIFSNVSYSFKYTDTERTKDSAKYFTQGLFGEEGSKSVWYPLPSKKDPILRFYKLCDKWNKDVKSNPKRRYELEKYKSSDEVHKMLNRFSNRIRLNYTLSFDSVHLIYVACGFETAWFPGKHISWCSPFIKKDLEILEYYEEIKYFWRDGYGYDINHRQACPLLGKAMDFFLNNTSEKKAIFYFTHSGTLLKTLSYIGLYKDSFKLTHNIDPLLKEMRNWKVSKMDTFGNNLIFVLFSCKEGDKLLTLHQEQSVTLNGCQDSQLCPLSIVRKVMPSSVDQRCDFTKMCSIH